MKKEKNMKKVIGLAAGLLLSATTAFATPYWSGSLYGPSGSAAGVGSMDWASSGSGGTVGIAKGGVPSNNTSINFVYQSFLAGLTASNGNSVDLPGLNNLFEYTIVAQVPELIGPTFGSAAIITSQSGGTWAMYYDDNNSTKANVSAGTGFNDGTRVAYGTINAGSTTVFNASNPGLEGMGSTILEGTVAYADPFYLGSAFNLLGVRFEGTVNLPSLDSNTNSFFDGNDGFLVTNAAGFEVYKVDGSSKFTAVPEPSTMILLGGGLFSLAIYSRRRKQK